MSDIDVSNLGSLNLNKLYTTQLLGAGLGNGVLRNLKLTARNDPQINNNEVNISLNYDETTPNFTFDTNTLIKGVATPVDNNDAVNKAYIDNLLQGLSVKDSVKVASIEDIPVSSFVNNVLTLSIATVSSVSIITADLLTFDGVLINKNDTLKDRRILIKDQSNAIQNGIYVLTNITQAGNLVELTRADDFNENSNASGYDEVKIGSFTFVRAGTTNTGKGFILNNTDETNGKPVVNTNTLNFTEFNGSSSGGGGSTTLTGLNGITITNDTEVAIDLDASTLLDFKSNKLHLKSSNNQGELLVSSGVEGADPTYSNIIGRNDTSLKIASTGIELNNNYVNAGSFSQSVNYGDDNANGSIRTIAKRILNEDVDINGTNTQFLIQRHDLLANEWKNICVFTS